MGEKLRQSDISEPNLFGELVQSAKALEDQLKETNTELNKSTKVIIDAANKADAMSQKGINNLIKMQKLMEANFKRAQTIDREKIKTAKLLSSAKNQQAAEDRRIAGEKRKIDKEKEAANRRAIADGKRLRADQEKAAKLAQKTRRATLDNANAYKTLSKNVNSASARLKRMAAQYGATDKRTIRAQKNFDRLDKKLRAVNNAARDGRRDVGRYGTALSGVKGSALKLLGALGLLGGGMALVRGLFSTISDFDSVIASLGSITGKTGKGLEELKDKVLEVSNATGKGAKEIADAMKLVGSAQPELLKNADALAEVTKQAVILAQAGGIDVPTAAAALTKSMNQFGVSAKEAANFTDILATSQQKGTATIEQISEAMKNAGSVAKASGLDFQQTNAILQALAKGGLVGAEAGTKLRSILLKLAKTGREDLNPATQNFSDILNVLKKEVTNVTEAQALFGDENAAAALTLIDQKDVVKELDGALLDHGNATEQAAQNMDTLAGQSERTVTALKNFILGSKGATSFSNGLKESLKFLANNLGTIVTVLGRLITVFAIYKVRMMALNLAQKLFNDGSGKMSFKLKTVTKNLKSSSQAGKGFGSALKGIGWAVAITGAIALARTFFSIVTGAAAAKAAMEEIERIAAAGEKKRNVFNKQFAQELKDRKALMDGAIDAAKGDVVQIKAARDEFERFLISSNPLGMTRVEEIQARIDTLESALAVKRSDLVILKKLGRKTEAKEIDIAKVEEQIKNLKSESELRIEALALFKEDIASKKEAEPIITNYTAGIGKQTEAVEDLTKAYKDLSEVDIQGILDAGQSLEDIESEEIAQENEAIQKLLLERLTFINDAERLGTITAKEAAEQRKIAQLEALLAQKKILVLYGRDIIEIDNQISSARLGLMEKGIDEEAAAQSAADKKKKDAAKKLRDELKKIGVQALDELIKISQEKQSLIDDEISKSKELEDRLRDGAKNGNAIATESLAEQESITEEKTRQKQREAKKEALLEEAKAIWNALNNFLDQGDKLPVAGAKAIGGVLGIKTLVNGLTGFFKGTKGRLKDEHKAQVSGKDGHVVRVDGNEAILTGSKMDKLAAAGLTTTDDIVNSAILNQQLIGIPMANAIDDRLVGTDNSAMEKKLDTLIDISKNNKPTSMHPVFKRGLIHAISEAEKKNGKITRNWTYK